MKDAVIEPMSYQDSAKLLEEEKAEMIKIGEAAIKSNKLAIVTMAGGQGTRLGHDGPKGTYDLGLDSHKSLFEIQCDILKNAQEKYGVTVPWYIMTSRENNDATVAFFEEHNYFDYPKEAIKFFKQDELPMIDLRKLNEIDEKQETVPYNISLGGGTQGLINVVLPNYMIDPYRKYPLEKHFAGTFIGYFKSFKMYDGNLESFDIFNNFKYEMNNLKNN
jgi:hypothetical protein